MEVRNISQGDSMAEHSERCLRTQSKRGFEVKQKALKYARFDCGPEKHCASAQRGSV